jgi:hypothetical protein
MVSLRLEQGKNRRPSQKQSKEDTETSVDYPSPRYFQIHFHYLYELIEALKDQVQEANRQIALQNEIIQNLLHHSAEPSRVANKWVADGKRPVPQRDRLVVGTDQFD